MLSNVRGLVLLMRMSKPWLLGIAFSFIACGRVGYDDAVRDAGVDANFVDMPSLDLAFDMSVDMTMPDLGNDMPSDLGVDLGPPPEPGVIVTPIAGLMTSETATTATFTVRLNSEPSADVSIAITSLDLSEVNVSPTTLNFTNVNWAAPQTVTVTGLDDLVADGDQTFTVALAPATSLDLAYAGFDASDVSGINRDDETPGVFVTPTAGLTTSEGGDTAIFTVVLDNEPASDVTIGLSSSDSDEGTVSPSSLTFTPVNWNAPQTVTVTGVDDFLADGNAMYTIETAPSTSPDPAYDGINAEDVIVTNLDDETPAILVAPTTGLTTAESGLIATFTVRLTTEPLTDVVLDLESLDLTEGTVSPSSLTFTMLNWNAMQTVTVSGVDDVIIDGTQMYEVEVTPNASSDATYASMPVITVELLNTDDETAGVTVTPDTGLEVSEMGDTAEFVITLNSMPTASVLIPLASTDTTEGTVSPGTVMFTPATWNVPRTVTITGVNDALSDGNQMFAITTGAVVSGDSNYSGIDPANVSVTNIDDDSPSILVTPLSVSVSETTSAASFSVRLGSMPTSGVTIPLMSSDTTEATVSLSSLVFNSFNYATAQIVTVTGVDDLFADGDQPFTIVLSPPTTGDATYAAINPNDVTGVNIDNDIADIIVSPTSGLTTTEAAATAAFSVRLTAVPTSNVTIALSSSNVTEGTVDPASLVFTTVNGTNPINVTVTGVNDLIADGNIAYTVVLGPAASADAAFAGMDPSDVSLTNLDNDIPAFVVTPTTVTTSESGTSAMFSMSLTTMPSANVVVGISSSNLAEASVSPAALTFTAGDFNMPHVVTVTGVQDVIIDGTQPFTVLTSAASSVDVSYNGLNPVDVAGTNTDDDYVVANSSVNDMGVQANNDTGVGSAGISMSGDGRYIAYRSYATNLVPGDVNGDSDIFVRDMMTGSISLASIGTDGSQPTSPSYAQLISNDGRYVYFASVGRATWAGYNGALNSWVRDLVSNTTTLVSRTTLGNATSSAMPVAVTTNNRYFMFETSVSGVVPGDTNGLTDLFVRDLDLSTTTRVSVRTGGAQHTISGLFTSNGYGNSISDDGRYVLTQSNAPCDIVPDMDKASENLILRDNVANTTVLISYGPSGTPARAQSQDMSEDGRYIVFFAPNSIFLSSDTNGVGDIYVYDRLMASFEIISRNSAGVLGNNYSVEGSISNDGRYVAFTSLASNLVSGDTNGQNDVFVRDRMTNTTVRQSVSATGAQGNGGSSNPVISGDGNWVAFLTSATNLFPGDTNGHNDVLRVPRL